MRKLIAFAAVALVAMAASCSTKNVGGGGPIFFSITGVSRVPAGDIHVNDNVTFTAAVNGASGPYNVVWNFGGAATPNTVTVNGATGASTQTTVMLSAQGTFNGTVTATDATNAGLVAGPFTFSIPVLAALNFAPTITSATYTAATGTIAVVVADQDAADNALVVTATTPLPAGFTVTPANATTTNGGTATFNVSATDIVAGANGQIGFTVSDGHPQGVSAESKVTVTIAPFTPTADTLYAIPLVGSAAINTPIRVLVMTGVPANPFQYLSGTGLTIESDGKYVGGDATKGGTGKTATFPDSTAGSFNVGTLGGARDEVDGFWTAMAPSGFLLAGDNLLQSVDISAVEPGRQRYDINVTPTDGKNVTTASGALYNLEFIFTTVGKKTFGFQQQMGVKRTYYASDTTEFFWGNIANDGTQVPNSVTIQ